MMRCKSAARFLFVALGAAAFMISSIEAQNTTGPVYELRTYVCEPGKLEALNERFKDHTMRIFEKHGMKNIAYWIPTDGETAATTLIYLLEHKSREGAALSWEGFRADPEWRKVAAESQEKHGKILSKPPEAIYFTLTDYSPQVSLAESDKTYELRVYTTAKGKLDALHSRFRDHTEQLLKKHGLKTMAYWSPMDEPKSTNQLYYILETPNREASIAGWKAFLADPEWKAAHKASIENGEILSEAPLSIFMKTTDYSPK